MEPDILYYRRRACEEMTAAARAVTQAARERRLQLVGVYLDRLKALEAPCPFDDDRINRMRNAIGGSALPRSAFAWPDRKVAAQRI